MKDELLPDQEFEIFWNNYGELLASMCKGNIKQFAHDIWNTRTPEKVKPIKQYTVEGSEYYNPACGKCGCRLYTNWSFCPKCGKQIDWEKDGEE